MSQWTHVNATIRFDSTLGVGLVSEQELGQIYTFKDLGKFNEEPNTILPMGNEGTLQYQIIKTGGEHKLSKQAVLFWGDLRHYDADQEILDYFTHITKDKNVRSGVLEIDVEFKYKLIYTYDSDNGWVLALKFNKE